MAEENVRKKNQNKPKDEFGWDEAPTKYEPAPLTARQKAEKMLAEELAQIEEEKLKQEAERMKLEEEKRIEEEKLNKKNEEWLRQQNQSHDDKHDEMKEKMMKSGMLPRGVQRNMDRMTDRGRDIRFNYDEQNEDDDVDGVPMDESRDRRNSRNSDNRRRDRDDGRYDDNRRGDRRREDDRDRRRHEDRRRGEDRRDDNRRGDDRRPDRRDREDRRDRRDDYNRSDRRDDHNRSDRREGRDRDGGRKPYRPNYVNDDSVDIPRLKTDDGREFYDMSSMNDQRHKNMFRQRGEGYVDPSRAKIEDEIQRKIRDQAKSYYKNRESDKEYADRVLDAKPPTNWNESKTSGVSHSKKRTFADEVKAFDMRGVNAGAREGNHEVGFIRSAEVSQPRYNPNRRQGPPGQRNEGNHEENQEPEELPW